MRVVHGIWARGALCLWAEDPDLPPAPVGRPPAPVPHPFTSQAAELADMLAALPGPAGEAARKAVNDELPLQLPSAGSPVRPLASPELVRPAAPKPSGPRPGRVRLVTWRVPVLVFAPAGALDLLRAVDALSEFVTPGASLPYLAALARFADGLAARGRVLPVLIAEEGTYAARWRVTWPRPCPRRAGRSAGRPRAPCWPPRSMASPTPRRASGCRALSCPRGEAVLRLTFLWPNDTWPH
jgi:hypothetical protein